MSRKVDYAELKQLMKQYFAPKVHGNLNHEPNLFHAFGISPTYFEPSEVAVGITEKVVGYASLSVGANLLYYVIPSFFFTYRWSDAGGTPDCHLWWTVNNIQRTAKFPLQGFDLNRHSGHLQLSIRDLDDLWFWFFGFEEGTHGIRVVAQTTAQTCYIGNRQLLNIIVGRYEL